MVAKRIGVDQDETLARFSRGELDRRQVMRNLDISYSELLERLSERELELPQVAPDEARRMACKLNELLDGVDRRQPSNTEKASSGPTRL